MRMHALGVGTLGMSPLDLLLWALAWIAVIVAVLLVAFVALLNFHHPDIPVWVLLILATALGLQAGDRLGHA